MSDYNDASIVMFPSGRKASKLYSQKPLDGSADFTVTRASVATEIDVNGLVSEVAANVPRFEYGVGVTCQSLLLEPQGINNAVYSEDFTNANWAATDLTVTSNSAVAPDGNTTADTITADVAGGQFQFAYAGTIGETYTTSFWVKRKTGVGAIRIRGVDNISTNVTVTNEWTRVSITNTASATTIRIGLKLSNAGDEVYLWGAQSEVGSLPSSYIRNLTTGTTTRLADTLSKTELSGYINSNEGTLLMDVILLEGETAKQFSITNGTTNNYLALDFGGDAIGYIVRSGNVAQASITTSGTTLINKIAVTWKLNEFKFFLNGVKIGEDLSGSTPIGLSVIDFDLFVNMYGKFKTLKVYKTALTDTELIALTT